jgi:hypothetical protein
MSNQQHLGFTKSHTNDGPVECLGMTFENDDARRAHFLKLLREKLEDPEFRKTPGFPTGSDEAILRMSDPPYYTACPNPFLSDFVCLHGRVYDPSETYDREPFAVDVSVGKTDQLYKAHGYHTKVPHLAIVPSILHYTRPGDVVLDGFCGSGMTGLAAQWCGTAPVSYRQQLEADWKASGQAKPEWGARKVILNDLGPAASFIAAGYNLPFDVERFQREAQRVLSEVDEELGWMYECLHTDGKTKGRINYTVWSEILTCGECAGDVNFVATALDPATKRIAETITCPHCGAQATKEQMDLRFETFRDPASGEVGRKPLREIALINYSAAGSVWERGPTSADIELATRVAALPLPAELPTIELPDSQMTRVGRMATTHTKAVHHLFLPRPAHAMAALWRKAQAIEDLESRRMVVWFVEQAIWGMSVLNRYQPLQHGEPGGSQVNRQMSGVYYVPSQIAECNPWYNLHDASKINTKLSRLGKAFRPMSASANNAILQVGDCASIPIPGRSIDHIFTDPPFGENIYYADLNFLVEAWHGVATNPDGEAIVDRVRNKSVHQYQELMRRCFEEYNRVLKPGRWMTVVFSNSSNGIWRAIQEAMGTAGFVVADVRTLDKKQGSYRQVTSSAVKQDLVISAYKPTEALTHRFELGHATVEGAWAFVREHLGNVPVFVGRASEGEVISERTAQMLLDRMIAFHVQRGVSVPLSGPEFLQGLAQRLPERDGMYFLPDQVMEYDRKRTSVGELRQLSLFINDEASAIQWVRQQLQDKPQSFQELTPQYMREVQAWAKHEATVELKTILEQNFLVYEGGGPVPNQIHSYLSTNYKALRNLEKTDARLIEKAADRWYVPDPTKQAEREAIREKALLREFEEYKTSTLRKLKVFRTEAVRAGFKACWQERDYVTIVKVAEKLPEAVLQEDEKLLMYYDNALTRSEDQSRGVGNKVLSI